VELSSLVLTIVFDSTIPDFGSAAQGTGIQQAVFNAEIASSVTPTFPGKSWTLTYPGGTEIWEFDSRQAQMAFFNDRNGRNATMTLGEDGLSLHGAYEACTIDGTLGTPAPGNAVLHTRSDEPDCVRKFGTTINVQIHE
jgi:hypothetical protein